MDTRRRGRSRSRTAAATSAGSVTPRFDARRPAAPRIGKVRTVRYTEPAAFGYFSAYTVTECVAWLRPIGDRARAWEVTEMASRVVWACRLLMAAFAALAIVTAAPAGVMARDTFDVTGTVESKNEDKETIVLITDALGKPNQPITIDMSNMSGQF